MLGKNACYRTRKERKKNPSKCMDCGMGKAPCWDRGTVVIAPLLNSIIFFLTSPDSAANLDRWNVQVGCEAERKTTKAQLH